MTNPNLPARFMRKVDFTATGCWLWTSSTTRSGYAQYWDGRTMARAHRFTYERLVGPIPPDLECDHLCRNRVCVNPDHIELVTRRENMARRGRSDIVRGTQLASEFGPDLCANGHEWTPSGTYLNPDGVRECRECRKERTRRWRRSHAH